MMTALGSHPAQDTGTGANRPTSPLPRLSAILGLVALIPVPALLLLSAVPFPEAPDWLGTMLERGLTFAFWGFVWVAVVAIGCGLVAVFRSSWPNLLGALLGIGAGLLALFLDLLLLGIWIYTTNNPQVPAEW